jgi:magnesium transporter
MVLEKLFKEIKAHIQEVAEKKTALGKSLWKEFINLHPADIAQFFSNVDYDYFKILFLNLPQKNMCTVFSEFSEKMQAQALSFLNNTGRIDALSCLTADELTDLFEKLSDEELKQYLNLLHKEDRQKVLSLLKFDSESAGGIMDTDVLALHDDFTVYKSIQLIQRLQVRQELHRQIFVIDEKKHLVGHIVLEDLVLQKPQTHIKTFMKPNDLVAQAHDDQEQIAQRMVHYNLMIVPVVRKDNYFLGVIPGSTLVDIIEEEASEDVYKMSAMEPVKGTYFEQSFWRLLYQRSYILIILLLAQSISSMIILHYEALLAGFLMIFITMLISTGGNASSQTSAVIIQGMASGEINKSNMNKFFKREFILAFAMALVLGVTAFARVYLTSGDFIRSCAVSASLATIVMVSIVVGSIVPVLLKKIGMDPAYAAGPLLATLMDILGLLIYCFVSQMFLFS